MAFTFTSSPMENWRSLQLICKLYFIWVLEKYFTYKHNWISIVLEFPSSYCVRSVCWASCYVTSLLCSVLIRKKTLWMTSLPVCVCYGFWTAAEVFLWYGEFSKFINLSLNFVGEIWNLPFKWRGYRWLFCNKDERTCTVLQYRMRIYEQLILRMVIKISTIPPLSIVILSAVSTNRNFKLPHMFREENRKFLVPNCHKLFIDPK